MIKITPRTRRFLKLFFVNFCFYAGIIILAGAIGSAVGYLIVIAVSKFGVAIVLFSFSFFWLIALVACMAGKAAEEKLLDQEYREKQLMEQMRNYE